MEERRKPAASWGEKPRGVCLTPRDSVRASVNTNQYRLWPRGSLDQVNTQKDLMSVRFWMMVGLTKKDNDFVAARSTRSVCCLPTGY